MNAETHVQWWSRKRPHGHSGNGNNNNHLRRSNIYTAHPADSIRGLQQGTLSAASSLTAITAMGAAVASSNSAHDVVNSAAVAAAGPVQYFVQQHCPTRSMHAHQHHMQHNTNDYEFEHEYHQPEELHLQHHAHLHQRQQSSSMSSLNSSPSLHLVNPAQQHHQHHHHQPQQHFRNEVECHWPNATMVVS